MGMFDGIKGGRTGHNKTNTAVTGRSNGSEAIADLDTMGAIEAHVRWKVRLECYLKGTSTEKIDPAVVEKDDQCILGKWIHGAGGAQYQGIPMVDDLIKTHAAFHKCAAEIVRKADRGEITEATDSLNNGEYSRISYRIKTQLARLSLSLSKTLR